MNKSPPQKIAFGDVVFAPRFEHGEHCSVGDNARIPWTTRYDEVILVLDGQLTIHIDKAAHQLAKQDTLWIPKGTALIYESANAFVYYCIHPVNWS